MRVLYLSYNGLLDPLGQSQVLQYLIGLSRLGHQIVLVTYEKADEWANEAHRAATRHKIEASGIRWIPLTYHSAPRGISKIYDLAIGQALVFWLCLSSRIEIVHVRGYVLAPFGLLAKWLVGAKFIFDPRSSWPDERVELGIWKPGSLSHRLAKWQEKQLFSHADASVVLTHAAADIVRAYPYMVGRAAPIQVITTCTNLDLFQPSPDGRARQAAFMLGYLGTVGRPYMLPEVIELLRLLLQQKPDARMLIVNWRDSQHIREQLASGGVAPDVVQVKGATHSEVPAALRTMTAGIFFYEPTSCQRFRAPTKLGEFLACGIPCISNAGIGDVERILTTERVGVVVSDFSHSAMSDGLARLLRLCEDPDLGRRCVAAAERHFSLNDGVRSYDALYRSVAALQ